MVNKIYVRRMKGPGWYWICHDFVAPAPVMVTVMCCGFNWGYERFSTALRCGRDHALIKHGVRI